MGFNQILRIIIGISEPWPVLHVRSSSDNIKESIAVLSRSGGALDQLICQFVQGNAAQSYPSRTDSVCRSFIHQMVVRSSG